MNLQLALCPYQWRIINNPARFLSFFAGRRVGKTVTALFDGVYHCLKNRGFKYWIIFPVYSQCFEALNEFMLFPGIDRFVEKITSKPYYRIEFTNGSRLGLRSFDRPRNLRGAGLDRVWVDEIQDIPEIHFWPVIRALISDRQGHLRVSGQFRGKNWYYKAFHLKGEAGEPNYASYRVPSSEGIVFQSVKGREELAIAKDQLTKAVYDQEYDCIPIANQMAVFLPDDIEACAKFGIRPSGGPYIVGFDMGGQADPSAAVVFDHKSKAVVHSEVFPLREKHSAQAIRLSHIVKRWHAKTIIDCTGGGGGGRISRKDVNLRPYRQVIPDLIEFDWTRKSKNQIIKNLGLMLEDHGIQLPAENETLLDQLLNYEYQYTGGFYTYSAPNGMHDDYVAALSMACWASAQHWLPMKGALSAGVLA